MFQLPSPGGFKAPEGKWMHGGSQLCALGFSDGERTWTAQRGSGPSWIYTQGYFSVAEPAFLVLGKVKKDPMILIKVVCAGFKHSMPSRAVAARSRLLEPWHCVSYLEMLRNWY